MSSMTITDAILRGKLILSPVFICSHAGPTPTTVPHSGSISFEFLGITSLPVSVRSGNLSGLINTACPSIFTAVYLKNGGSSSSST